MPGNLGGGDTGTRGAPWSVPRLAGTLNHIALNEANFSCYNPTLWRPSDGQPMFFKGRKTAINDITVAGPAVNGRDQAAAFGASDTIHFYLIWNGTTFGSISSTSSPQDGGPELPTSYTHWAYVTSTMLTGGAMRPSVVRGATVLFAAATSFINNAAAPVAEATATLGAAHGVPDISSALDVPPDVIFSIEAGIITNAGGIAESSLRLNSPDAGTGGQIATEVRVRAIASQRVYNTVIAQIPLRTGFPMTLGYLFVSETNPANIASRSATVNVLGFVNNIYSE